MTLVVTHVFSLVLYNLAEILSVDDLCIFEFLILARVLMFRSPRVEVARGDAGEG